jgi:hypothetical protein
MCVIMRHPSRFLTTIAAMCALFACRMTQDEQYIRETIPIEIQLGVPVIIKLGSLSGNGWNEVGIRCSPEIWEAISAGPGNFSVRLISSDKDGTSISNALPGGHGLWPVDAFYYLFSIGGHYHATSVVEMVFRNAPAGTTKAEIIVLKTPADTGL